MLWVVLVDFEVEGVETLGEVQIEQDLMTMVQEATVLNSEPNDDFLPGGNPPPFDDGTSGRFGDGPMGPLGNG
jgi:hypothetical protein